MADANRIRQCWRKTLHPLVASAEGIEYKDQAR
jgi:hypothetical protein